MIQKWLTYMLVALIAMQSVVAIADAHQSHQEGTQHLEFEHEHDSTPVVNNQDNQQTSTPSLSQYDCHHCCHCHGLSLFALTASSNGLDIGKSTDHLFVTHLLYRSYLVSPDIRPPIV